MSKKILITSALPYVNGIPHLGHLAGCLLPSDVYARHNRRMGREVLFIGGTDEHGTPSELGAAKEKADVREYVDKYHKMHADIYKAFGIEFDYFGRTSSKSNHELTRQIAREMNEAGYIEEREEEQIYSADDGRFLPDRYVTGTCPYCGYEKARGDQCENCTKVMEPRLLINPRSTISGSPKLEFKKTKHLYFLLSKTADRLRAWVDTKDWNKLTSGIAYKWLDEGLEDRSITRDLKWGVPVPADIWPDLEGKVFYVWFDAPIGYISATKDLLGDGYEKWWLGDDVRYVEFMGKDNVPFHTIFFPGMLIATGRNWHLVDEVKGISYMTFNGGKFSKSDHRGIFADDAMREFPETDYMRYFIMKNLPETDDTDFSFEKFADDINKDLNDILGNFVLRVLKFYVSKFGAKVIHKPAENPELDRVFEEKTAAYNGLMDKMEFRKAMAELRSIWALGNEFIDREAPWSAYKTDPDRAGATLAYALGLARLFAELASPIIPAFAQRILDAVRGGEIAVPEKMFDKIPSERVAELNGKYNA
jgi:methionyl-tRNA synthetase